MCRDAGRNNYFVWCRWGRVGELGAMAELGPFVDEDDAKTAFAKKFRDKTGNKWEVRWCSSVLDLKNASFFDILAT